MLIGEKLKFAIECEIRNSFNNFVYCNFRFWIAGNAIGDWSEEAVLGVLINSAKVFLLFQGDRHLEVSDSMSTKELWHHIARYSNSDDPNDLRIGLKERYRPRFLLHDIADDSIAKVCEMVVVERADGIQRLLWKNRSSNDIQETTLPPRTVDKTVADFLQWAEMVA